MAAVMPATHSIVGTYIFGCNAEAGTRRLLMLNIYVIRRPQSVKFNPFRTPRRTPSSSTLP